MVNTKALSKLQVLGAVMSVVLGLTIPMSARAAQAAQVGQAAAQSAQASHVVTATAVVNINTASAAQLEFLPGVGPAIAARIVSYRGEHGAFKSVDELVNVRGIKAARLAKMRGYLTLTGATTAARKVTK